jgi:putative nucleotidyltransferase with HDIG domain
VVGEPSLRAWLLNSTELVNMTIHYNNSILCVDDEPDILERYQDILGQKDPSPHDRAREGLARRRLRHGKPIDASGHDSVTTSYDITLAQSGEEAVALVRGAKESGQRFAAGFFDMKMPSGLDGYETIKKVLEIDSGLHCAIVTAYTDRGIGELNNLFTSQDQWLYLNKPFGNDELTQIAHHLVATYHLKKVNSEFTEHLENEVKKRTLKYKEIADRLILVNQFSREISTAFDIGTLLGRILEELRLIIDAQIGSLLLVEEDCLVVKAASGPNKEEVLGLKNDIFQSSVSSHVLKTKVPLLIGDLQADGRFFQKTDQTRPHFASLISVPLLAKNKTIGVMNFGADKERKIFSREECDFIDTMAGHIAMAIENSHLYQQVRTSYDRLSHSYLLTIQALTKAIDAKDHYTYGHSERVARYSLTIARAFGVSDKELTELHRACILHDVGKIGISEAILNKPNRLTSDEFSVIKSHPARGAEIMKDIPFLEEICRVTLHHHEAFDGTGYPDGIAGEEIPLHSRIMAVADTFDAMTSDRPYRKGLDAQVAFDEIRRNAGSQFDPAVVQAFLRVGKG